MRKGAVAALRYALMEKERATPIWTPGEDPSLTPSSIGDIHEMKRGDGMIGILVNGS